MKTFPSKWTEILALPPPPQLHPLRVGSHNNSAGNSYGYNIAINNNKNSNNEMNWRVELVLEVEPIEAGRCLVVVAPNIDRVNESPSLSISIATTGSLSLLVTLRPGNEKYC